MACTCGHSEPIVPARTEPLGVQVQLYQVAGKSPGTMVHKHHRRRRHHDTHLSLAEATVSEAAAKQWKHCPESSDVMQEQAAVHAMSRSSFALTLAVLHVPLVPAWHVSAKS